MNSFKDELLKPTLGDQYFKSGINISASSLAVGSIISRFSRNEPVLLKDSSREQRKLELSLIARIVGTLLFDNGNLHENVAENRLRILLLFYVIMPSCSVT